MPIRVNPIPTRGAYYAHHIFTGPPQDFQTSYGPVSNVFYVREKKMDAIA